MHYLFLTLWKAFPKRRKSLVVVFLEGQEGRDMSVEGPSLISAQSICFWLLLETGEGWEVNLWPDPLCGLRFHSVRFHSSSHITEIICWLYSIMTTLKTCLGEHHSHKSSEGVDLVKCHGKLGKFTWTLPATVNQCVSVVFRETVLVHTSRWNASLN